MLRKQRRWHAPHRRCFSFRTVVFAFTPRSAFLFPLAGRHASSLDFECQEIALEPVEIARKWSNALRGENDASEAEYRACVVPGVRAADERAQMAELVEVRDVERGRCARNTKARAFARASESEQARARVRPTESVESGGRKNKW